MLGTREATKTGGLTVDGACVLITVHGSIWNSATDDAVMVSGGVLEAELNQTGFRFSRFTSEQLSIGPPQWLRMVQTGKGSGTNVSEET